MIISSSQFAELMAYRNRNTLHPDLWWSNATTTSMLGRAMGGHWVDPRLMVPGQIDVEEWTKRQERLADKSLDRQAKEIR